jgi:class 3 adenylate cyclase
MPDLVKIKETVELPHAREAVWPVLAKTDWINRAVGLPPVNYEVRPLPEGGSHVTARARVFGMKIAWQEFPFEWTEPKFYQVRRIFLSGPLAEGVMGLRLRESPAGCAIDIFADFMPRIAFGTFFARSILGPKTMRDMRGLLRHVSGHLAGQQPAVMPKLPAAAPNQGVLDEGLKKLRAENLPEPLIGQLREFLTTAPDVELSHIRPFAIARDWSVDRWEVLRLFLHATRAGLLDLRWEVLCPNCRSTRLPRAADLKKIARIAHCDVCNIRFDAEFDKSVELKFSVSPALRPCDEQTFCLVGPGGRPHIVSQINVEAGQEREWDVPELTRRLRLRSLQVKEVAALPSADTEIICRPERFELSVAPAKSANPKIRVVNPNSFPVQLVLEAGAWTDEVLTASLVTNWQEFRDLFSTEVISPTEQIVVGSQVVLFTDLRGSTAMYSRIGDAPAYALVRDHFTLLHDIVSAQHGTVVKTIGDAIMATFSNLAEALAAVRQMHEQLSRDAASAPVRLQLKSALHTGPCLAVNANDRLDFFGTNVNLAARLIEKAQGDDLVVTDEIYWRNETQQFIAGLGRNGVADEEKFTGFPQPVKVWKIPVLQA